MTDWGKIAIYASFIEKDPFRMGLHYPAIQAEIGHLHKRILDVGCGDGLFSRLLATQGASVVGYDKAPERIAEALQNPKARGLRVAYSIATPASFSSSDRFDAATSVMVLNYASSIDELGEFFGSTCRCLVPGGVFVSVILNPSFKAFGEDLGVRRISTLGGGDVKMEFFDDRSGIAKFTAVQHQYTRQEFEQAAARGGMRPCAWKALFATPDAVAKLGQQFWRRCHETQPYALLLTRKPRSLAPAGARP